MNCTKPDSKMLSKIPKFINASSSLTQIALGGITGLTTGCVVMKLGKTAAAVTGGGLLIAQIAHSQGYGNMDWKKIKAKAEETTKALDSKYNQTKFASYAKEISDKNTYFAAGFVGGFLIGASI